MLADYHIHCHYSDDSWYPMEQVIQDAIAIGLDEICFTDHVDYGIKIDWPEGETSGVQPYDMTPPLKNVLYPRYFKQLDEFAEKYKDQITIKKGLEFGIQPHTIPDYEKLAHDWPLDFILLSVHQIDNKEFWTQDYQQGKTREEVHRDYWKTLLELVKANPSYSVLAHMDLIVRYDLEGYYPIEPNLDLVEEILKTVIANGKGIEVNTSSDRYGLPDLTPSRKILEMYRDLGGEILTIGSDSHAPEHLGYGIEKTQKLLKEMGFSKWHTFEKGVPVAHDL